MMSTARATIALVPEERSAPPGLGASSRPAAPVVPIRARGAADRPHAQTDEATLVAGALRGDRWAEREIWYRHAPMVYGLLRRSLSSRHDPDDLVQEVFLRVFRRLSTLENTAALRSFIYSVGVRVVCEEIRHFQVLQRTRDQLVLIAPGSRDGGADLEARDGLARLQHLLDGMKDKHRAVFVLRHVEGMELLEIAAGLGISLASVKRYLIAALRVIEDAVAADEGLRASLGLSAPRPEEEP